jgi:hypothetical protein
MELIRTGPGDDVEDTSAGSSVLGTVIVGLDLELLDDIRVGVDDGLVLRCRGVRSAVQEKVVGVAR